MATPRKSRIMDVEAARIDDGWSLKNLSLPARLLMAPGAPALLCLSRLQGEEHCLDSRKRVRRR
jgi:hypothetical protein